MKEKSIIVKERSNGLIAKGLTFLAFMLISLLFALLPLLVSGISGIAAYFYIAGGILFAIFTALFIALLYRECNPRDAIILNAHGFTDIKNIGAGIEIEWTNVASVKLINRRDNPLLGIKLENTDIVLAKMKKNKANEMRENIEDNLPAILIAQNDVKIPIEELKNHFTRLARDARILEQAPPSRPKVNPFTTDDVLRAFGKLPKENSAAAETQKPETNEGVVKEAGVTAASDLSKSETVSESTSGSFYDSLFKTESQSSDIAAAATKATEEADCMPPELQDILKRAKSTKISEIEKILADPNTPAVQKTDAAVAAADIAHTYGNEAPAAIGAECSEKNESETIAATSNENMLVDGTMTDDSLVSADKPAVDSLSVPPVNNDSVGSDDYGFVLFNESADNEYHSDSEQLGNTEPDDDLIFITNIDDD